MRLADLRSQFSASVREPGESPDLLDSVTFRGLLEFAIRARVRGESVYAVRIEVLDGTP